MQFCVQVASVSIEQPCYATGNQRRPNSVAMSLVRDWSFGRKGAARSRSLDEKSTFGPRKRKCGFGEDGSSDPSWPT